MADIPGAPTQITFGAGDCAEEKILEFMQYQDQYNQAFCNMILLLTGGGDTIQTIREKHSYSGTSADSTFLNPIVPLTTNCCVLINGGVCIPSFAVPNQTQNPSTETFIYRTDIKCDGVVVDTRESTETIATEPGGTVFQPKQTIFISANLDVTALSKTPDPGVISICTYVNDNPFTHDVTLTSLVICQVDLQ